MPPPYVCLTFLKGMDGVSTNTNNIYQSKATYMILLSAIRCTQTVNKDQDLILFLLTLFMQIWLKSLKQVGQISPSPQPLELDGGLFIYLKLPTHS